MPPRSSHLKSRYGCQQCKKRRIKCDETHPICTACIKHRISCSFNSPQLVDINSQVADPITSSHLLDLELLHQFTSETFCSLAHRAEITELYRTEVISLAFKHDYLIHSILAISALHLAIKTSEAPPTENRNPGDANSNGNQPSPPSKAEIYRAAGHKHHNRALQLLRQNLASITPENCHAVFVSSTLVFFAFSAISATQNMSIESNSAIPTAPENTLSVPPTPNQTNSFASSPLSKPGGPLPLPFSSSSSPSSPAPSTAAPYPHANFSRVLEWLRLLRGIFSIVLPSVEWLSTGPLADMVSRDIKTEERLAQGAMEPETDAKITAFTNFLSAAKTPGTATAIEIYLRAIATLRKYMVVVDGGQYMQETALLWPVLVSEDYATALENKTPEALVILAFYAVMIGKTELKWCLNGWPRDVIRAVEKELAELGEWKTWLEWPLETLGLDPIYARAESPNLTAPPVRLDAMKMEGLLNS